MCSCYSDAVFVVTLTLEASTPPSTLAVRDTVRLPALLGRAGTGPAPVWCSVLSLSACLAGSQPVFTGQGIFLVFQGNFNRE